MDILQLEYVPGMPITLVSSTEADAIIATYKPRGRFWTVEPDKDGKLVYIGIDNTDGEAWVEEFSDRRTCWRFLKGCRVKDLHGDWVG